MSKNKNNPTQEPKTWKDKRYYGCTKHRTKYIGDPYMFDFTNTFLPKNCVFISDIDLVIRDCENRIMLIEIKRNLSTPSTAQRNTYAVIHELLLRANGTGSLNCLNAYTQTWSYHGAHLLQFENTSFEDGRVYFNFELVKNEKELAEILNFQTQKTRILSQSFS
jgi:hypothetical protein